MGVDAKTLAAAKKYTDTEVAGGGAIKGKNCVVDSIIDIIGGHRVTFKWTLDNGTVQTNYMDVMDGSDGADGADGLGIASVDIDNNNHLIITYDDSTTYDAGEIKAEGQTIQRNVLPTASVSELKNIYQYIGADDPIAELTNGYFYQCVLKNGNYIWEEKKVQSGGGSGASNFKDLDDTSFSNLKNGDLPVYNNSTGKWENSNQIPLDVAQLAGSMANLKVAIENLDLIVASKVDKQAGKDLSSNDYTDDDKEKVTKLQPIYLIGSGLNLDGSVLKATGISIPMDDHLDTNSSNPVQNKAIAVPIEALQGSVVALRQDVDQVELDVQQLHGSVIDLDLKVAQLQGSMIGVVKDPNYVHTDNNYTNADQQTLTQLPLDVSALQGSVVNLDLKVDQLEASMVGVVKDPNYVHTDNNFTDQDKTALSQIPLDVQHLQGSVISLKLAVNQMSGSLMYKADKTELDEFTGTELVGADHKVTFDNLDDGLCYKLCGGDRIVRIEGNFHKENSTLYPGKIKLTFTTDAPQNTVCKLRILK